MSNFLYFFVFVVFLFCQYAIWVVSNFVARWVGVTGQTYWCIVLVAFLILNELAFGSYDFSYELQDETDDEEWLE